MFGRFSVIPTGAIHRHLGAPTIRVCSVQKN